METRITNSAAFSYSRQSHPALCGGLLSELAVELSGVRKSFGEVRAVKGLDLTLERGKTYGLLGPNGSGKTTTMRMVLSIILPDEGDIRVLGRASAIESKQRIGYLPEDRGLYKSMRVRAFLDYMARLRGVPKQGLLDRIKGWLERVDLGDKLQEKCGSLSRGQQQRVQTIAALIHEPDLLILDEPFSGLDPVNRRALAAIIGEQKNRGCTLVFSTHMMHHAEEICDHVVMMDRGEKLLDVPLGEARSQTGPPALLCEPIGEDLTALEALPGVERLTREKDEVRLELADGADPNALLAKAASALPMRRVEVERLTLEEIFVRTVAARGAS